MSGKRLLAVFAVLALLVGCEEEEIEQNNLDGTLVLDGALVDEVFDGDARKIGMVYIGIFEDFDPEQLGYPYPSTGPRVGDQPIGDALPYGGTSIGVYSYGCYRALACNMLTGRYPSLEDVLEVNPIELEDGEMVSAETMYDQCTWYYGWNAIEEFSFVGQDDLDFQKNDDGDYEASFRAWHGRTPPGARIWAFADNDFTSCSPDQGVVNRRYGDDLNFFREGTNYADVLNFPDKYVTDGDFISSEPPTLEADKLDGYEVRIDYLKD